MVLNLQSLTFKNFNSSKQNKNNVIGFIKLEIPNSLKDWVVDHAHLVTEIILAVKVGLNFMNIIFCCFVRDFLLDVSFMIFILHVRYLGGALRFIDHVVVHLALKTYIVDLKAV